MATLGSLKTKVLRGKIQSTDPVEKATYPTYKKVTLDTTLEKLDRILDKEHFAMVVHSQRICKGDIVLLTCNKAYFTPAYVRARKEHPEYLLLTSFVLDTTKMDVETKEVIVGIVTDIDLLQHVTQKEQSASGGNSNGSVNSDSNSEGDSSEQRH